MTNKKLVISANTSWQSFNFCKNLISQLFKSDYDIVVLAPRDQYSVELIELTCDSYHVSIDKSGINSLPDLRIVLDFYPFCKRYSPAVTLSFTNKNNIYSSFTANRLGIFVEKCFSGLGTEIINKNYTVEASRLLFCVAQINCRKLFFKMKKFDHYI